MSLWYTEGNGHLDLDTGATLSLAPSFVRNYTDKLPHMSSHVIAAGEGVPPPAGHHRSTGQLLQRQLWSTY